MRLKICGMREPDNILEAAKLLPAFMGFIFWEPSARFFSGTIPELPASIEKTGVFVDASFDQMIKTAGKHHLSHIQLHGNESPETAKRIQQEGFKVIKALGVGADFDPAIPESFENTVDYFLFDTKGKLPGGNGTAFDWKLLESISTQKPFFLSGGIGPGDAEQLHQLGQAVYGIDVNSRFEIRPGLKDIGLLQQFKKDYHGL